MEISVEEINPSRRYEEFWVENRKASYVTEPASVYERAAQHRRLEMVTAPRFHPSLLGPLFDVIFLFFSIALTELHISVPTLTVQDGINSRKVE